MSQPTDPGQAPEDQPVESGDATLYIPNTTWPEPPGPTSGVAPRFDPMTGTQLDHRVGTQAPVFDPMTGKRLIKRKRRPAVIALIAFAVVALVAGVIALAVIQVSESEADDKREARAARERACVTELQPVYDALLAIDGRMSTGANIEAFSGLVGAASTAVRQIDTSIIDEQQCAMHDNLSTLVTQYGLILQGWNDCLFEYDYCDPDTSIDVSSALSLVSLAFEMIEGDELGTDKAPEPLDVSEDAVAGLVAYL
ncbi:hypothetical protein NODU109028_17425 [Nocardioides dubius]|uniref:Uncharacterized protein n=1 Tax=Nocardioides dubius TaxID=317019 RepID=A0ABN1TKI6_9ACTN